MLLPLWRRCCLTATWQRRQPPRPNFSNERMIEARQDLHVQLPRSTRAVAVQRRQARLRPSAIPTFLSDFPQQRNPPVCGAPDTSATAESSSPPRDSLPTLSLFAGRARSAMRELARSLQISNSGLTMHGFRSAMAASGRLQTQTRRAQLLLRGTPSVRVKWAYPRSPRLRKSHARDCSMLGQSASSALLVLHRHC
jgi:hypothetical protein